MSEINNFSDYASKYNTNVDYSYLFGGTQAPTTGGGINLSDYAAISSQQILKKKITNTITITGFTNPVPLLVK